MNPNLEDRMILDSDLIRTEFLRAEQDDRLSRILGNIRYEAFAEVLVFKEKTLRGIFSPVFAASSKHDISHIKMDRIIRSATSIEKNTGTKEAIRKMIESDYNALPVKDKGEVIGVLHIFDLINLFEGELERLKVRDIKLQKSNMVNESEGIGKAINDLHEKMVRALVVLDGKQQPIGVITHLDIIRNTHLYSHKGEMGQKHGTVSKAFRGESNHLEELPIENFIKSKAEAYVLSSDPVLKAVKMMKENNILNLLVKDTKSIIRAKNILRHQYLSMN